MDGIHDVGGRHGYGPIEVTHEDPPFPTAWEGRAFGIMKSMTATSDYSSDKFRYTREQLPPLEFLTAPYFAQWLRAGMAMLVGSGLISLKELSSGRSDGTQAADVGPPKSADDARIATTLAKRSDGPFDGQPRFSAGDRVGVSLNAPTAHTRLPQYVRGRCGRIAAYCGAHSVPDDNVRNVKTFEPLYTVAFSIGDLFEEQQGSPDEINVDIWERFLDAAQ